MRNLGDSERELRVTFIHFKISGILIFVKGKESFSGLSRHVSC